MKNKQNLLSKERTQKQNRVWVRIAAACNNKCIFCLDSDAQNGTFPDQNKVEKEIRNGYKKGQENRVIISGGEASINPKFPDYIKYAKQIGYDRVQTVTNGNMFFVEKFCHKVFEAGLQEVTFSFHGHNSKLHDYLVATPGAFKKSLKGLIYIKKHYPQIIINIDIVVNKVNVKYLPDIVKFFMKLGVYEYDILQIIPFGRGFSEYKTTLFYDISDSIDYLKDTWKLSKIEGMYMWTNRFHTEAFEGFEDLIQDPRKIKSEVMGESREMFEPFIKTSGKKKPECFGERCDYCFLNQYCHGYLASIKNSLKKKDYNKNDFLIIHGEEFPSLVYEKYGENSLDFKNYLKSLNKKLINIPKCLSGTGVYSDYNDLMEERSLEDYTSKYIKDLYRKKSLRCRKCKYYNECEGIHLNFIRSYGFNILEPIK